MFGADLECGLAVDRPGKDGRAGGFGHPVGLTGEIAFVHRAAAGDDAAVDRADLVGEHDDDVTDSDVRQGDVGEPGGCFFVGDRGHAAGQGMEHVAGSAHGPRLDRLAAGEHEHDEHTGEILAQDHARDDRDPGEHVGAEFAASEVAEEAGHERHAANEEHRDKRKVGERERPAGNPAAGIKRAEGDRLPAPAGKHEQPPRGQGPEGRHGNRLVKGKTAALRRC